MKVGRKFIGQAGNGSSRWTACEECEVRHFFAYLIPSLLSVRLLTGQSAKAQTKRSMDDHSKFAATVSATLHQCLRGCRRDQAW